MLNSYKEHKKVEDVPPDSVDLKLLVYSVSRLNEDCSKSPVGEEQHHCVSDNIDFAKKLKAIDPVTNAYSNLWLASSTDTGVVRLNFDLKMV